jgi:2-polyprenyl-3-methyl-5-hydroxy-6-metoxy-1,4-benzoquinol methylase
MEMSINNNYVFKEDKDGKLTFVGDFEGLYRDEDDPWSQSCKDENKMSKYYNFSRNNLINLIEKYDLNNILEVGCGIGVTTDLIKASLNVDITGMDISKTAIDKSQQKYTDIDFINGNITDYRSDEYYDTIILMQILWYILETWEDTIENCYNLLSVGGNILFSQAFLKEQRYGKNIIDGYYGLVDYFEKSTNFEVIYSNLDELNTYIHNDGLVLLRKK